MNKVNTSNLATETQRGKGVNFCRIRRITGY